MDMSWKLVVDLTMSKAAGVCFGQRRRVSRYMLYSHSEDVKIKDSRIVGVHVRHAQRW